MTRTIDADALINTLNEKNIPVDVRVNYEIMNAPTIEPDADTISRSQAIKDVSEWATDILHPDKLIKEDAIHILESLSSAETPTVLEKHQLSEETPTNTSTDLISRQDAVKEIDSFCDEVWTESEADFARGLGTALSIVESLPSAEQVTGKLNNPDDSLLTADSEACKEQKSKLDLISRQAVLSLFPNSFYSGLAKQINALPSAPDSRQRGEWIFEPKDAIELMFTLPKCSECGFESSDGGNFCPNCGARMLNGGEQDGNV